MVKLTPPGQGQTDWTETTVWTFSNVAQDINCTPDGLVMDASGALYGTTQYGDAADGFNGSVYKLVPPSGGLNGWTIENLYSFKSAQEGSNPQTQLTMGKDGVLYGIAPPGGVNNQGVVFEVMPSRNGKRTPTRQTIWNFTGGDDGSFRVGPIIVDVMARYMERPCRAAVRAVARCSSGCLRSKVSPGGAKPHFGRSPT